ncbi:fluoride efflux transporter FluC [Mobilicoccus pelagius]|uniref:Fluoride-specific ion channel FluC n=1 Tax=Mobilicoccus pelagius NBRC 104925 TaxID=1089455 RepID=H5USS2_9MICO|nr:CrcB family protein [Mobilicoccus pelagius]GAB48780.1 protein CrcB homolog [Mobilicoccus pelagius NBRC 104925]
MGDRPPHRDPRLLAAVFVGGAIGTLLRAAVGTALPAAAGTWPWATFLVNLTGAFLLGLLLESLARSGPDVGGRRTLRLFAGTGLLGGYTTYSTFAVEITHLAAAPALAYATLTVSGGLLAAIAGVLLARHRTRRDGRHPLGAEPTR